MNDAPTPQEAADGAAPLPEPAAAPGAAVQPHPEHSVAAVLEALVSAVARRAAVSRP